ncbi:hypothetical protein HGM15179_019983, partial [Zosterops borbonicus]
TSGDPEVELQPADHWPVKYDIFESKWTQLAARVVAQNTTLGPQDPRCVIGTDELLGTGNFADLNRQAAFDLLVLDQCQKTGMAALVQTIEMAAPKESFVTVVQGPEEPFLRFAERLTASVERQDRDPVTRRQRFWIHWATSGSLDHCPDQKLS